MAPRARAPEPAYKKKKHEGALTRYAVIWRECRCSTSVHTALRNSRACDTTISVLGHLAHAAEGWLTLSFSTCTSIAAACVLPDTVWHRMLLETFGRQFFQLER